ncbi:hypothetical protein K490DRAFT_40527 [Saccharata proteae CBS 121410]|uniref:Autophagy-related protein 14 n=1 Tax=Saccharata proteae CBS 121410 TaxID=1314787 RepID=A0A9P4LW92_9PEZI|nr:hypothetical protein K490DRAFT_40527 [Saccharata proteae CBS 121410]
MDCGICGSEFGRKVKPNCATCARCALEELRMSHAGTLIGNEALREHVRAASTGSMDGAGQAVTLGSTLIDTHESAKSIALRRIRNTIREQQETVSRVNEEQEQLRTQIEERKRDIAARKAAVAQRRSDLSSATYSIDRRRAKELQNAKELAEAIKAEDERGHLGDMYKRVWCCKKAAEVANLRRLRHRSEHGSSRSQYVIGGIRILDLRELNGAHHNEVSASLDLLARLVVRVSGYLCVRLPAEITLPHKDWPRATIFPIDGSYTAYNIPFPGSTPISSTSNSPEASRSFDPRNDLPRPRPLFIDEPLKDIAKKNPSALKFFIEGVSWLAWDIAWLCRTQGMTSSFNDWQEVCPMGRNLWHLIVESAQASLHDLDRELAKLKAADSTANTPARPAAELGMGHFSHGMANGFLETAEGKKHMKGWKLQSPTRVVDKLRSYLQTEMQGAEWEVLDEKEWEMEQEGTGEDPGLRAAGRSSRGQSEVVGKGGTSGGLTARAGGAEKGSADEGQGRARGHYNGWTKVKSRSEEERR